MPSTHKTDTLEGIKSVPHHFPPELHLVLHDLSVHVSIHYINPLVSQVTPAGKSVQHARDIIIILLILWNTQ